MTDIQRQGPSGEVSLAAKILRWTRFNVERHLLFAHIRFVVRNPQVRGKVSVITPTYRRPAGLHEAIASVRAQTYSNWEQIVVADGPDDQARAVVESFKDPRVRYYSTRRTAGWGNYQRNYALNYTTGEFVLYLDDDNIIFPHCFATMVGGFASPDIGFVLCPVRYGADRIMAPTLAFRFAQIDLLNCMFRRRLVERVGGQNRNHGADFVMVDRIRRRSRGVVLDEIIGHHR